MKITALQFLLKFRVEFHLIIVLDCLEFSKQMIDINIKQDDFERRRPKKNLDDWTTKTWTNYCMWSIRLGLCRLEYSSILFESIFYELKKIDSYNNSRFSIPTHIVRVHVEERRNVEKIQREKLVVTTVYRLLKTQENFISDKYYKWHEERQEKRDKRFEKLIDNQE